MDKTIIEIRRIGDKELTSKVDIAGRDELEAATVALVSLLLNNRPLEVMVAAGLMAAHQHPEMLEENTVKIKGGAPWENK